VVLQVCVFGTKGDTGLQVLASSSNDFERNKQDVFFIKAPDIGTMTDCRVGMDMGCSFVYVEEGWLVQGKRGSLDLWYCTDLFTDY